MLRLAVVVTALTLAPIGANATLRYDAIDFAGGDRLFELALPDSALGQVVGPSAILDWTVVSFFVTAPPFPLVLNRSNSTLDAFGIAFLPTEQELTVAVTDPNWFLEITNGDFSTRIFDHMFCLNRLDRSEPACGSLAEPTIIPRSVAEPAATPLALAGLLLSVGLITKRRNQ